MSSTEQTYEMNVPTPIAIVAKRARLSLQYTKRFLFRMQAENPNLMRKIGKAWYVDMVELDRCWPGWGREMPKEQELAEMRTLLDQERMTSRRLRSDLSRLACRVTRIEARLQLKTEGTDV